MNYNEEMAKLFNELGLEYDIEKIEEKDKAKAKDYIDLENRLLLKDFDKNVCYNKPKKPLLCLRLNQNSTIIEGEKI